MGVHKKVVREATRDISYASSAKTRGGRAVIRTVENLTGRPRLIRAAQGYQDEVANGRDFWEVMAERYELGINFLNGSFDAIPKSGPLIVISNHPFGILDGLMLGNILSQTRGDFRILAHRVFRKAEELDRVILPISFDESKEAVALNVRTRKEAHAYLEAGGCIGIFPGGTVSTAKGKGKPAMDPAWRTFTARLISKSDATVIPLYFDGANSRLFQTASRLNYTLRMALLIREFKKRVGDTVDVAIGAPIPRDKIDSFNGQARALMDFLREETYRLSPKPMDNFDYGFEFEEKHR